MAVAQQQDILQKHQIFLVNQLVKKITRVFREVHLWHFMFIIIKF